MRIVKGLMGLCIVLAGALATPAEDLRITMPGSPLGIAWGFPVRLSGRAGACLHAAGARHGSRLHEDLPHLEPGGAGEGPLRLDAVDAFLDQLKSPDEGLISLFSASEWATRRPAAMLPPSPAKNPDDYYRFVRELVKHAKGRVKYWQNDCEPNNPVYWSGSKEEFVAELKVFYKAVKDADPSAVVLVGGYDGVFNPPGMPPIPFQQAGSRLLRLCAARRPPVVRRLRSAALRRSLHHPGAGRLHASEDARAGLRQADS